MGIEHRIVGNTHDCKHRADNKTTIHDLCCKYTVGWNIQYSIKEYISCTQ